MFQIRLKNGSIEEIDSDCLEVKNNRIYFYKMTPTLDKRTVKYDFVKSYAETRWENVIITREENKEESKSKKDFEIDFSKLIIGDK